MRYVLMITLALSVSWLCPVDARAQPRIELLTFGPGDSLWERFGHTAVRVKTSKQDLVFSFGNAPFREPAFIWSYLRGGGQFQITASPYASIVERYRGYNRQMESQLLHLPPDRMRWLALRMYTQVIPPNNHYLYDQLFDNCSTRVRDLIDEASLGALRKAAEKHQTGRTFRDYTLEAGAGHLVGHWGLDLVGGPHQDLPVDGYQEMYLPAALHDRVAEATVMLPEGLRLLADPPQMILLRKGSPARSQHVQGARIALIAFALFTLGLVLARRWTQGSSLGRAAAIALGAESVLMGTFGLLVWLLVSVSNIPDFRWNENVFLFWPTDFWLLAIARAARPAHKPLGRFVRAYLWLHVAAWVVLVVLKLIGVFPQHNWPWIAVGAVALLAFYEAVRTRSAATA